MDKPAPHFTAYDEVLGRHFRAPTRRALAALMNEPRWVAARRLKAQEREQQQASNQRYGEEQQALAIIKRTRKRAKAIVNARQQAIRNAYDNSLATGFVNEFGEVPFEVYDAALSKFPHPQPITINHSYQDQPTA